ncbi:MAG: glycosyltransferase [Candidatus Omnitrophica bacterium]|nr:glycosyltransferase [Candidatus Omnitrophota bacterium]
MKTANQQDEGKHDQGEPFHQQDGILPYLSVVIPVFNGQRYLPATLAHLVEFLSPRGAFEIVVVDDGSADQTAELAQACSARDSRIRLVRLAENRGKGAAVREGMRRARGAFRIFCDADLPISVETLERPLALLRNGCDIAIASRALRESAVAVPPTLLRQVVSPCFNRLIRALFRLPYQDTQCGLKGFTQQAAEDLFAQAGIDGFAFDVELLVLARLLGYRVGEFPVRVENTAESSVSVVGHTGAIGRDVWRILRNLRSGRYRAPGADQPSRSLAERIERSIAEARGEAQHPSGPSRSPTCIAVVRRLVARPLRMFAASYVSRRGSQELDRLMNAGVVAWGEFLKGAAFWELTIRSSLPQAAKRWELEAPESVPQHSAPSSQPRETLAVVILTKNEEARIARALASVAWADEVIVVDGGSTDRTVEICRRFGAAVIVHAFDGSFAMDRNVGSERAASDWVLQMDADDVVTPGFRHAMEQILREGTPHAGLKFYRRSVLLGRVMRFGGWHYMVPNLARRTRVRYEGLVHERSVIDGTVGELPADIEHHPCEDLMTFAARQHRYTTLQAEEWFAAEGAGAALDIRRRLWRRPWKIFWKSYVKKQGYREGWHGLVFAELFAGVEFLKWAKCWELARRSR